MINSITFWVWVGKWPIWFAWEMYLLWRRRETISIKTLSQVAMRRAFQFNSAIYADVGLLTHFIWLRSEEVPYATARGVAFWAILVLVLVFVDLRYWRVPRQEYGPVLRWVKWPITWVPIAVAAGYLLFPQVGPTPWNWTGFSW